MVIGSAEELLNMDEQSQQDSVMLSASDGIPAVLLLAERYFLARVLVHVYVNVYKATLEATFPGAFPGSSFGPTRHVIRHLTASLLLLDSSRFPLQWPTPSTTGRQRSQAPGSSFSVSFKVCLRDCRPFWFHPFFHARTNQAFSGIPISMYRGFMDVRKRFVRTPHPTLRQLGAGRNRSPSVFLRPLSFVELQETRLKNKTSWQQRIKSSVVAAWFFIYYRSRTFMLHLQSPPPLQALDPVSAQRERISHSLSALRLLRERQAEVLGSLDYCTPVFVFSKERASRGEDDSSAGYASGSELEDPSNRTMDVAEKAQDVVSTGTAVCLVALEDLSGWLNWLSENPPSSRDKALLAKFPQCSMIQRTEAFGKLVLATYSRLMLPLRAIRLRIPFFFLFIYFSPPSLFPQFGHHQRSTR
jgi:hypothetical protein